MSNKTTLLPEYISIIQQPSLNFYKDSTPLLDYWKSYLGELETLIDFQKSKSSANIKEDLTTIFKKLNDNDFVVKYENSDYTFDDIFKLYVIEKFNVLDDSLKKFITDEIGSGNVFFVNYSDDIGDIVEDVSVVDSGTNPFYDLYSDDFNYTSNIACSLNTKISLAEKNLCQNLSLFNDSIMKTSLKGLLKENAGSKDASTSHGSNLVTDVLYIDRLRSFKEPVKAKIKTVLNNMTDFINFFKQVNYRDKDEDRNAIPMGYTAKIENIEYKIDILKNKI